MLIFISTTLKNIFVGLHFSAKEIIFLSTMFVGSFTVTAIDIARQYRDFKKLQDDIKQTIEMKNAASNTEPATEE